MASPTAAMAAVFKICELTELILSQMELIDLIASTSVCQQWRNLIFRSHKFQQRLLEDALLPSSTRPATQSNDQTVIWNRQSYSHWILRLPSSLQNQTRPPNDNPPNLLIYRTSTTHIELLLNSTPGTAPILLDTTKSTISLRKEGSNTLKEATWYSCPPACSGNPAFSVLIQQTTHRKDGSALTMYCGDDGRFRFAQWTQGRWEGDGKAGSGSETNPACAGLMSYLRTFYDI